MVAAASAERHLKQPKNKNGLRQLKTTKLQDFIHFTTKSWRGFDHSQNVIHGLLTAAPHIRQINKAFCGFEKSNMWPWTSHCRRGRWRVPPVHPVEPVGRRWSCSPGRSLQTQRSAGGTADLTTTDGLDMKEKLFVVFTICLQMQKTSAGIFLLLKLD